MVYVKHFDILGIDTAQIPCIELQGAPNAATVGAVGLLGIDVTSDSGDIYVCTAVNGAVYTWKPFKDGKDGTCVVKSEINANGELILTLSDGKTLNAGVVKGEPGENGKNGYDGRDGIGVTYMEIDENDGDLYVSYSNGKSWNLGRVVGRDGVSIVKAEVNASLELIITLSNDTVMNLGSIKADHATIADSVSGVLKTLKFNEGTAKWTSSILEAGKLYAMKYNYHNLREWVATVWMNKDSSTEIRTRLGDNCELRIIYDTLLGGEIKIFDYDNGNYLGADGTLYIREIGTAL